MSKKALSFPNFIASLNPLKTFPKQQIMQYLKNNEPTLEQCIQLVEQYLHQYQLDCRFYKQMAVVLWGCLYTQAHRQIIQRGLVFFESLLQTRLLLLIFNDINQFVLDQLFFFLEEPIELTVRKAMQLGMASRLMQLFKRNNQPGSKTNQILFLLELLIIKKIKKQLDHQSTIQFMQFLKKTLSRSKWDLVNHEPELLKFKMTAILRQHDQSCQTFALQFKNKKLHKVPERGHLPQWVVDAYVNRPQSLDLSFFKQKNVMNVMSFLQHAQIYASSPKIDQFDQNQDFLNFFSNFLMGNQIGEGMYRFGTEGAKEAILFLKQRLAKEEQCYHETIITQCLGNKNVPKKI